MARALLILANPEVRAKAAKWIANVPDGTRVLFQEPKRRLPQNDRLHAMLTDLAGQLDWHGQRLSVDDWKLLFMHALNSETRMVPAIDGKGFVALGRSTSKLSKSEFSDLMTIIEAFGAAHQVRFADWRMAA